MDSHWKNDSKSAQYTYHRAWSRVGRELFDLYVGSDGRLKLDPHGLWRESKRQPGYLLTLGDGNSKAIAHGTRAACEAAARLMSVGRPEDELES